MAKPLESSNALATALLRLKQSGMKCTSARKMILQFLCAAHGPFSIEEIYAGLQSLKQPSCDLSTLYRSLGQLEKIKLVRRSDFGDRLVRFEISLSPHPHHHLVCTDCHRVEVIENSVVKKLQKIAQQKGFFSIGSALEFFGLCLNCHG